MISGPARDGPNDRVVNGTTPSRRDIIKLEAELESDPGIGEYISGPAREGSNDRVVNGITLGQRE